MIIQGKAYWFKVIGKAHGGYPNGTGPAEWSTDISIDAATRAKLEAEGADESSFKNKGDDRGDFIQFKRREIRQDGEKAVPYGVFGPDAKPWPAGKLVGNGSTVRVKCQIQERPAQGGKKVMKPTAFSFQIVEHIPYEGADEFEPVDSGVIGTVEDWSGE